MRTALLPACLFLAWCCCGQDYPRKDFALEKLADEIFPIQDQDLNYEELYENLAQLLSNPLDLNTVTREQLRSLFVVDEEHINTLLEYRDKNGPLLSVYELQAVPNWTRAAFEKIIPFVTVYSEEKKFNKSILTRIKHEGNNYLVMRCDRTLETRKGYSPETDSSQRYAGSPDRIYLRFRAARSNDFSLGFTAEKDAGEAFAWSPPQKQYGMDYFSWHAQIQNKGRIKNLVIGDFQSQFGQGLVLGSAFGFGKNAETITTVRRTNLGFLPYTSLNESMSMSGVAASVSLSGRISIHGFVSRTFPDAHVTDSDDDIPSASSLGSSGLHRTPSESRSRKKLEQIETGGVLQYKTRNFDAGLIFHQTRFSIPVQPASRPYNQFSFRGHHMENAAFYLNYSWANVTFFGEAAQTVSHGGAFTAGFLGSVTNKLELSVLLRKFDPDFYSFRSNAFSENTTPQNEQGVYWGWKFSPNRQYSFTGYMDLFRFPWLRYRGYSLSEGSEWLIRFNYSPAKKISLFFQVREESKIRNLPDESGLYRFDTGVKRNYWINCDYAAGNSLTLRTRVQFSSYSLGGRSTQGLALVQDISWSVNRWAFSARFALFDTDDYDNRIYLYERDVWLAFSFPAYEGTGIRNYFLVQYKLSKHIDLWFRWSRTRYTDRTEIGSASQAIASNTINDAKFQVRIQF